MALISGVGAKCNSLHIMSKEECVAEGGRADGYVHAFEGVPGVQGGIDRRFR